MLVSYMIIVNQGRMYVFQAHQATTADKDVSSILIVTAFHKTLPHFGLPLLHTERRLHSSTVAHLCSESLPLVCHLLGMSLLLRGQLSS